jgi:hypothetical protein
MTDKLTHAEAAEIAAQWGSMVTNSDPGRIFYSFPGNRAPELNDDGWKWALEHCDNCLTTARDRVKANDHDDGDDDLEADVEALESLRSYIEAKGYTAARDVDADDAKAIFREEFDKGDPWGSVMQWLFALAGEIHFNRPEITVPDELQFSPGAAAEMDSDDPLAYTVATFTDEALVELALTLHQYEGALKRAGYSY